MDKKSSLVKKLSLFKKALQKRINVSKMLLFGSYARGEQKKYSDIDLLIVSRDFEDVKFTKRSPSLYQMWHFDLDMNYPVDFVCYSSKEYEKLKKKVSLASQATKEGLEIN